MLNTLTKILERLQSDPTEAIQLYGELYGAQFFALVRPGTELNVDLMEFVTYPAADGVKELPIFTSKEFVIDFPGVNPSSVEVSGNLFWSKLLEVVETDGCQVAVNPGQSHGIRLTGSMILGMISKYGNGSAK